MLKVVIIIYLQVLLNLLYIIFLTSTYYNTLINSIIVIYFNYKKDSYFILFCLELKDINNIKNIKEKVIFNKL